MTDPRGVNALMSHTLLQAQAQASGPTYQAELAFDCDNGVFNRYDLSLQMMTDTWTTFEDLLAETSRDNASWRLVFDISGGDPFEARPARLLTEDLVLPLTCSADPDAWNPLRRLWTLYEGRKLFPALSSNCTAVRFALLPASACSAKAVVPALPAEEPVQGLSPLALGLLFLRREPVEATGEWPEPTEEPAVGDDFEPLDLSSRRLGLLFLGGRRRRFGR